MEDILSAFLGFILVVIIVVVALFALIFAFLIFRALTNPIPRNNVRQEPPHPDMNEGDFHSGPAGYSPNTAYPDTFYGSGMEDEGDWRQ